MSGWTASSRTLPVPVPIGPLRLGERRDIAVLAVCPPWLSMVGDVVTTGAAVVPWRAKLGALMAGFETVRREITGTTQIDPRLS
ncbi:hypothetical protein G5C66_03645 [Nocardioides sp. KC13]|uniref:Uncharacterized protein n=1 Tax=Nocardioides turkmenicus TaxID=2711220 RepID=A0A6M1QVG3_9ACTN|nr:hypothetical protein [Nocardioides sp. KC13]NGN91834.1 hypothetical protein [Nocardioides sp. KC13]